jgi:sulfate adenylyltransferase subunit 1 (EFTu-like GTPase family)
LHSKRLKESLVDEIDASRGDSILNEQANINRGKSISATFCWMQDTPLIPANAHGGRDVLHRQIMAYDDTIMLVNVEFKKGGIGQLVCRL